MSSNINSDEIDIKLFLYSLIKHKYIILIFSLIGIFSGYLINAFSKEKWEGEFQIVLEEKTEALATARNISNIGRLIQNKGVKQELQTEFEILKSPSVLLNIFESLKVQKSKSDKAYKSLSFKRWRNKFLRINLVEDTTILNVKFIDDDKKLIIPTLKNISSKYQSYSTEKRSNSAKSGMTFFQKQLPLLQEKSNNSLKEVQEFAMKYDLIRESSGDISGKGLQSATNIEAERVKAATIKREIVSQIEKVKNIDPNSDQILYFAKGLEGSFSLSNQIKNIDKINLKLNKLKTIYLENDISILNTQKEKLYLIKELKKDVLEHLLAAKELTNAKIKSSERPKDIIVKYGQLMSNATKDKRILDEFELGYLTLKLENSKINEPWKLITNPTLIPSPIFPKKQRNLNAGFFTGVFIGCIGVIYYERLKKVIYSIDEIEKRPILASLDFKDEDSFEGNLKLIEKNLLSKLKNELAILILGDIPNEELKRFELALKGLNPNTKLIITKNVISALDSDEIILLISLGNTTKLQFKKVYEKISLQPKEPLGILVIDNLPSFKIN